MIIAQDPVLSKDLAGVKVVGHFEGEKFMIKCAGLSLCLQICADMLKMTYWKMKRGFSFIFLGADKFSKGADMEKFNEEKTLAAILYLANQDGKIDLYALLKTLYYADKNHLHEWGRTITGDFYVRMPYGPVPSNAYDMLKSVRGDRAWKTDLKDFLSFEGKTTIKPLQLPDMNKLSETNIVALQKSFKERGHKSFPALRREAHNDAAFKLRPNERKMTEEDLAEGNQILRLHLEEIKENERFLKNWRYLPPFDKED